MSWAARALHWHSQQVLPLPIGMGNLLKLCRDGDRSLQLLIFNEEFLVSAIHQIALITSLPFVHTARRSYRLSDPVSNSDCGDPAMASLREVSQTLSLRGRTSRNKASVGEPAEGSFTPVAPANFMFVVCADFDIHLGNLSSCWSPDWWKGSLNNKHTSRFHRLFAVFHTVNKRYFKIKVITWKSIFQ